MLALATAAPPAPALAGSTTAVQRPAAKHPIAHRPAAAPARSAKASRTAAPRRLARQAPHPGTPRLRDAPQELLPPPGTEVVLAGVAGAGTAAANAPRAACLAAARRAERVHGLPEGLLVAIALSESGLHAHALSIGGRAYYPQDFATARAMLAQAPARSSVMAGCVQVNARVHARGSEWPLDPIRSADWAGGILRRWYMETGSWEEAIRRWHGGSAASTRRVMCRVRAKLEVTAPGATLLQATPCRDAEAVQARRNGAALLEVAEMQEPGR